MRVFAIADPHLSGAVDKPMSIFGPGWEGHPEAFYESWRRVVAADDLVLIPGDISWAMTLEQAQVDLEAIAELPGEKVLLRGNHDYWWPSISRLRAALPEGMFALQNDVVVRHGVAVAGTRGWICPGSHGFGERDDKIYRREVERLKLSLAAASRVAYQALVVMMHFPPTNSRLEPSAFTAVIEAAEPDALVFGHVHGAGEDVIDRLSGIAVHFVAADAVGFEPMLILEETPLG